MSSRSEFSHYKSGVVRGGLAQTVGIGDTTLGILVIPTRGCACPYCGTSYISDKLVTCSFCHKTIGGKDDSKRDSN